MKRSIIIFSILSLICVSCNVNTSAQYTYQKPEQLDDGIQTGTLEEAEIDVKHLEEAMHYQQEGKTKGKVIIYIADN